jgi:hypothetical protein
MISNARTYLQAQTPKPSLFPFKGTVYPKKSMLVVVLTLAKIKGGKKGGCAVSHAFLRRRCCRRVALRSKQKKDFLPLSVSGISEL